MDTNNFPQKINTFKYRVNDWSYSLRCSSADRSSLSSMVCIFLSKVSMTFTRCSTGGLGALGSGGIYLQKTKPCIRKHLITKADRSIVDCLCECAENILRGNVPLTKLQKEKHKRNKSRLYKETMLFPQHLMQE
jgi:hypothetical protein